MAREVADVVDEPAELAIGRPIASMSLVTVAEPTLAPGEEIFGTSAPVTVADPAAVPYSVSPTA
jgi:hypothetical protein